MKRIFAIISVALLFGACSTVKPSSMASQSVNNTACRQNVSDGIVSILSSQGVANPSSYVDQSKIQTVMTMASNQCLSIQTPDCTYDLVINNVKGQAYLTLFRKIPVNASKPQTSIKGFATYKLDNCQCN